MSTIRLTTYFGDVFVLDDPVVIEYSFGTALRGPYEHEGQEFAAGTFYLDSARSVERVEEAEAV